MLALMSLTGMPFLVLMPVFADRVLNAGPAAYGILMSASGMGVPAGAARWPRAATSAGWGWSRAPRSCSEHSSACLVLALDVGLGGLLLPIGFSMMVEISSSNTLIQTMVPDALRGRVMAVYSMMFMEWRPRGAPAGWAADRIGSPSTVLIGGAACMIAAAIFR